jgi:hypothetical protein
MPYRLQLEPTTSLPLVGLEEYVTFVSTRNQETLFP